MLMSVFAVLISQLPFTTMRSVVFFLLTILKVSSDNGCFDTKCDINLNRCFKFVSSPATYSDAEESCIKEGGHLVSIENGFVEATIAESATQVFSSSDFWIGANFIFNNRWSWTDGTQFSYANWAPGQPSNNQVAAMQSNNYWINSNPNDFKPYVCEIFTHSMNSSQPQHNCPKVYSCETGWTYFAKTQSCYKAFFDASFTVAEATCEQHGGHLTSIHNDDENNFVAGIASDGKPGMWSVNQTWIGMYRETSSSLWIWTDETKVDYLVWGGGVTHPWHGDDSNCVMLAANGYVTTQGFVRKWINYICDSSARNFICKTSAV